ncbi:MAG: PIN domain-containing protein [Magnetococcales bacterium]|nr:PIN domain-containing protein [Magnetococcales bacterium]MBF0261948.1 PIN domain-containing protein [Magnetococcales bacterium]
MNVFLDTNVLVYTFSGTEVEKRQRACLLLDQPGVVISTQNLNELANVLTRKFHVSGPSVAAALRDLEHKTILHGVGVSEMHRALSLMDRYGYGYYDSLIIASALISRCEILYSEDLQHGQWIEACLRIVNPFLTE